MSDLSAVMGASSTIRTLVDGSLKLSIDIEPRHAQAAFALFGAPGTPIALARITNEAAVEQDRRDTTATINTTPKGGALARLAAQLCADPEFWKFVEETFGDCVDSENQCALWMRCQCSIRSRAELDSNEEAAEYFHEYIRKPWLRWRTEKGLK